jgi:hypothetical protein
MILAAGNALDHEALTLCQQFCEHFNDPAVYMAGARKWIADSAQNWTEGWRKPVDCHWNQATPSRASGWPS